MRALRKVVADAGQVNRKGYSRRTGRTGRRDSVEGVEMRHSAPRWRQAELSRLWYISRYFSSSRHVASHRICIALASRRRGLNAYYTSSSGLEIVPVLFKG